MYAIVIRSKAKNMQSLATMHNASPNLILIIYLLKYNKIAITHD